jgi:glutamyl-tRNA synthetase
MTTDELVERFALERVSKNPAVFDEQKLRWMNGRYMRDLPVEDLHRRLEEFYGRAIPLALVEISREKMQTLADFWPLAGPLVDGPLDFDEKAWAQWGAATDWQRVLDLIESVPEPFGVEEVEATLRAHVDELGAKPKDVYQPIRVALTGTTVSPGIFESLAALGRDESVSRVQTARQKAERDAA